MTDQTKIPAPEPVAWADNRAVAGRIGSVESTAVKANWEKTGHFRPAAERLTHPLITLAAAETYAAAREAAARQDERERCQIELREWAVQRWHAEVENRPLVNHNRRPLDDCWRQVMRHAGLDPEEAVGPSHDALWFEDCMRRKAG